MRVYRGLNEGFEGVAHEIATARRQIAALQSQQQAAWSNAEGVPIAVSGRIPGSDPPSYGFQFLDPTSHAPTAFFGEDGTSGTGLFFYNANGDVTSKIDFDGLHTYDASGNERTRLGILPNGDYGIAVFSLANDGTYTEVQPRYISSEGSETTTSTAPVAVTGTSVSAVIGATGKAFVTLVGNGEMNGPATGGGSAYFAVGVDGTAPSAWAELQTNLSAAQITTPVSVSRMVTGLTAGTHTFEAYVWSDNTDHSALLDNAYTIVEPV